METGSILPRRSARSGVDKMMTKEGARWIVLTGIVIALLGITFFTWRSVEMSVACSTMCTTMNHGEVPLVFILAFLLGMVVSLLGIYLYMVSPRARIYVADTLELDEDERKIVELLKENGGILFQSDIVEYTGFSKAKVSRILDKLEVKGVVEKRRRGNTNVVILKTV